MNKSAAAFMITVLGILILLAGCAPMVDVHGNLPSAEKLAQITPGSTSHYEVERLLGTPSTKTIFDNDTWLYISSRQERFAFYPPRETDRKVIAIDFNENGTVKSLRLLGLDDGRLVEIANRTTPTYGHEMGVLEQIVGNIGRFETAR